MIAGVIPRVIPAGMARRGRLALALGLVAAGAGGGAVARAGLPRTAGWVTGWGAALPPTAGGQTGLPAVGGQAAEPAGTGGQAGLPAAGWEEVRWPFPRDAWPAGRAFRCATAGCGGAMQVYVRPKVGFCNCATGVSDDAEVDGVSDLDMISPDFRPLAPGMAVAAGGMAGRTRRYVLTALDGREHAAAGFALSVKCDVIAAAVLGPAAGTEAARQAVLDLLGGPDVAGWIRSKLGKA